MIEKEPEYIRSYGRKYRVTAKYATDHEANEAMKRDPDQGVIAVRDGWVYLADVNDKGEIENDLRNRI